jgi:hypothetical protein
VPGATWLDVVKAIASAGNADGKRRMRIPLPWMHADIADNSVA